MNIDYHVELHGHYYSVPHPLSHELVDARLTVTTVELFHRGQRVATHVRSHLRGRHTTDPAHMPKAHQRHLEWTPSRFITWAGTIGPQTAALVEAILADRPHPEQGYRSCLGILRLAKRDGDTRLEAACARAVAVGARSYRHVDSILKHGLDRLPGPMAPPPLPLLPAHDADSRAGVLPRPGGRGRPGGRRAGPLRGMSRYGSTRDRRAWRRPGPRPPRPDPQTSAPRAGHHHHPFPKEARMLNAPTLEQLQTLKLAAMATAWTEQQSQAEMTALAFDERFALLVDAEWRARENKRLTRALQDAKLKLSQACLEAIDYPARRELDKAVIRQLATCRWVAEHQASSSLA